MRVSTKDLRAATELLLQHLDATEQSVIEIADDYYWALPASIRYRPYEQPTEFTMGQLSDDWAEIDAIAKGTKKPVGYALVWLSAVLQRVGELAKR